MWKPVKETQSNHKEALDLMMEAREIRKDEKNHHSEVVEVTTSDIEKALSLKWARLQEVAQEASDIATYAGGLLGLLRKWRRRRRKR